MRFSRAASVFELFTPRRARQRLKRLYWRIALVFLGMLVALGALSLVVTARVFTKFIIESEQRLNWSLASEVASSIRPYLEPEVDITAIERAFYELSRANPRATAYLLDEHGKVQISFLENRKLEMRAAYAPRLSVDPIRQFIAANQVTAPPIYGDDPRELGRRRLFSAAQATYHGRPAFVYVVFGNTNYDSLFDWLAISYVFRSIAVGSVLALIGTGAVGLLLFFVLTARFRMLTAAVEAFQQGDYRKRVKVTSDDEVDQLAAAFNSMAATIESNIRELEQNDQLRRNLVANVSHDLRGPLTSIQGFLQMLQLECVEQLDARGKHFVSVIAKNVGYLGKLANELFDLSKLEASEYEPNLERFSVAELARDVLIKCEPRAQAKSIALKVIAQEPLPDVIADEHMIERVLANLVDNALRYTPKDGEIRLELSAARERLLVSVIDSGCGVPEEDLPHLFDRFYRVEKDRSRSTGGSGLGLAIVKRIVEAHGGTVEVESVVGEGTTFRFDLPSAAAPPRGDGARQTTAH